MSMAQGSIAITHAVSREGGEGHTARRRSFKDRRVATRAQTSRMRRDASQKRRSPGTRGKTSPTPELSPQPGERAGAPQVEAIELCIRPSNSLAQKVCISMSRQQTTLSTGLKAFVTTKGRPLTATLYAAAPMQ